MSLAGLVAYDSSDDSDNEDCQEENTIKNIENTSSSDNSKEDKLIQDDKKLKLPEPVQKIKENKLDSDKDDVGNDNSSNNSLFGMLPKPISKIHDEEIVEEDDNIPVRQMDKIIIEKPITKNRGPVKISIPSLADFDDVEESADQVIRKIQPSKKLPGVLAMLPPPKTELISTKNMIPHVLTKKQTTTTSSVLTPTQIKKKAQNHAVSSEKVIEKTKVSKALDAIKYASDSEDEEDPKSSSKSSIDFFSLSEPVNLPISEQAFASHILPMPEKVNVPNEVPKTTHNVEEPEPSTENQRLTSTVMNLPRDEILMKNKAEVGPKLPVPEQEFHLDSEGNVAFDDKAIEYLCGRRGIKRKNKLINETEIIDINGEDIKPDEREWLVKALTEEPVQRPVSLGSGPGGQSKKKHQITYLAHQAKAMEIELKNQWAANKYARMQAKSKYGF